MNCQTLYKNKAKQKKTLVLPKIATFFIVDSLEIFKAIKMIDNDTSNFMSCHLAFLYIFTIFCFIFAKSRIMI